ncbi:hypothetical protein [Lusitaniella coriacea]|uniref:hypothetical protein n=1 Tax=Lusitaniella coriacea TaxID=1983105 RepID=UPI003CEA6DA2
MLILLLMIVGLVVVGIQNWLPALPLVVFGYATPAFPLALWMAGAIAAGLLTSTILQLLNFRPTPSIPPNRQPREPEPRRNRDYERSSAQKRTTPVTDWEMPAGEEDWGTKATPPSAKPPKPKLEKEPRIEKEVQPPQSAKKEELRDRVYDANYRVLNTPNPQPPEQPPTPNSAKEEEDWGFDDDEFESDYRQQWRDRE